MDHFMSPNGAVTPVDAHVHLYHPPLVGEVLDEAARNFSSVSAVSKGAIHGCLLLAGTARCVQYQTLLDTGVIGKWTVRETHDEPHSAIANGPGGRLVLIAGRQIRTAENLEVLALGTLKEYPEGRSLAETVEMVHDSSALAVLPWGLGKWSGERLELLADLLQWVLPDAVFLGDNGGRLGIIDSPPLLKSAATMGFRILPGSDPFPLPGDWKRIGKFGFKAEIELSERDPWRVLRDWLKARPSSPVPYGEPLSLGRFIFNQIGIQAHNRWHGSMR